MWHSSRKWSQLTRPFSVRPQLFSNRQPMVWWLLSWPQRRKLHALKTLSFLPRMVLRSVSFFHSRVAHLPVCHSLVVGKRGSSDSSQSLASQLLLAQPCCETQRRTWIPFWPPRIMFLIQNQLLQLHLSSSQQPLSRHYLIDPMAQSRTTARSRGSFLLSYGLPIIFGRISSATPSTSSLIISRWSGL